MTSSKHDYANYDQFVPNFDMAWNTMQVVSVPNSNLFGKMKAELLVKEVEGFSITLYNKMGWWAFFCPPIWWLEYKCMEIYKTLNNCNSCIYWYIDLKPVDTLQNSIINIV